MDDIFDHLFTIQDPFSSRYMRCRVQLGPEDDPINLIRGTKLPAEPPVVNQIEGQVLSDLVWTDYPALVLVSARLIDAFKHSSLTGWLTYPVSFRERPLEHYLGLCVTGRCGRLDGTRGEWVRKDDEPGRFLRGIFFDEQSWDRSDFFMPEGTTYQFITERVRDLLQREGVKNLRCQRLSDVLISEAVISHSADFGPVP